MMRSLDGEPKIPLEGIAEHECEFRAAVTIPTGGGSMGPTSLVVVHTCVRCLRPVPVTMGISTLAVALPGPDPRGRLL